MSFITQAVQLNTNDYARDDYSLNDYAPDDYVPELLLKTWEL